MKGKVLAERPVLVEQGHADRGIRIEHLLGGDHLDLVHIGVEPELLVRDVLARIMNALQGVEIPVRALEETFGHEAAFS
jgi:hypothetical protein